MYDSITMIDAILKKIGALVDSRGIDKCILACEIVQMLTNLQDGIKKESEANKREIANLLDQLNKLTALEPKEGETVVPVGSIEEMIQNGTK